MSEADGSNPAIPRRPWGVRLTVVVAWLVLVGGMSLIAQTLLEPRASGSDTIAGAIGYFVLALAVRLSTSFARRFSDTKPSETSAKQLLLLAGIQAALIVAALTWLLLRPGDPDLRRLGLVMFECGALVLTVLGARTGLARRRAAAVDTTRRATPSP